MSPKVVDWYEVLKVSRDATEKDIRQAYRRLALIHHPDKTRTSSPNGREQDASLFIALSNALQILLDPAARAQLDRELQQIGPKTSTPATSDRGILEQREALLQRENLAKSPSEKQDSSELVNIAMLQKEGYLLRRQLEAKIHDKQRSERCRTAKLQLLPGQESRLPAPGDPGVQKVRQIGDSAVILFDTVQHARDFVDRNTDLNVNLLSSWHTDLDLDSYYSHIANRLKLRSR